MKKFAQEIRLIFAIAFGLPMLGVIVTSSAWWNADSRVVLAVYLVVCLALFALLLAVSLRDEMAKKEVGHGRR